MDEFIKSKDIGKSSIDAILDMVSQQNKIMNLYKLDPFRNITAAMSPLTSISKMIDVGLPKYAMPGQSLAYTSIMSTIPKDIGQINKIHSALGLSNIEILIRQMTPQSFGAFQNIFSPALQIQKSLSSLYSPKSAFANYGNLYSNPAFWGQLKELQTVISAIPKVIENTEFALDNELVEDFNIKEVFEETNLIAETIDKTKTVSYNDFEALKSKVDAIYSFLIASQKPKHGKLLSFILFLLFTIEPLLNDIVQQVQHYNDSKTNVSHEDIKELSDKFQQSMAEIKTFMPKFEYRYAKHSCLLKLKCNTKSQTLYQINKGDSFFVSHINKKWLFVSIVDRVDGIQISGWVQKKYTKRIDTYR